MSFGYSIGDALTLVQLAWRIVEGTRKARGEYDDLTRDVLSYHSILSHLQSEMSKPELSLNQTDSRRDDLSAHMAGCQRYLERLGLVLDKYNALSERERSARKLWKKVRFGNGEVQNVSVIRQKITTYVSAISMTVQLISLGSQGSMEQRLRQQGGELQDISQNVNLILARLAPDPSGSVMTTYADDDKEFWKTLRRELVNAGYNSTVIQTHRRMITDYIKELGSRGVLDEEEVVKEDNLTENPEDEESSSDPFGALDEDQYEYVDHMVDGVIYREYSRRLSKTSYKYHGHGTYRYYSQAQGSADTPIDKATSNGASQAPPLVIQAEIETRETLSESSESDDLEVNLEDDSEEDDSEKHNSEKADSDDKANSGSEHSRTLPAEDDEEVLNAFLPPHLDTQAAEGSRIQHHERERPNREMSGTRRKFSSILRRRARPDTDPINQNISTPKTRANPELRWAFSTHPDLVDHALKNGPHSTRSSSEPPKLMRTWFELFQQRIQESNTVPDGNSLFLRQYERSIWDSSRHREDCFFADANRRRRSPMDPQNEPRFYKTVCPLPVNTLGLVSYAKPHSNKMISSQAISTALENVFPLQGAFAQVSNFALWLYSWAVFSSGIGFRSTEVMRDFAEELIYFQQTFMDLDHQLQQHFLKNYQKTYNSTYIRDRAQHIAQGNDLWIHLTEEIKRLEEETAEYYDPSRHKFLEVRYVESFKKIAGEDDGLIKDRMRTWSKRAHEEFNARPKEKLDWECNDERYEQLLFTYRSLTKGMGY